jgi:hypothetical protein
MGIINKAKVNSIECKELICAKVKSFILNTIYNNFSISYLPSISGLANIPNSSIFNVNCTVDYGGMGFE